MARLWISGGGEVTCERHAGHYLATEIAAHPRRTSHHTPLGTWLLYRPLTLAEQLEAYGEEYEPSCEGCDFGLRPLR